MGSQVVFLGGSDRYSDLGTDGARAACEARGAHLERLYVPTGLDMQAAIQCITERLLQDRSFTAVFCSDDVLALGIGLPEEVSVIGFDDLRWTQWLQPSLITVGQPQASQGEAAMEMLAEMMQGHEVESRLFEPHLVVRNSTAPVAPIRL